MQNTAENFLPILFQVLFGLVILNLLINFALVYTRNVRMNRLMTYYWLALLVMYVLQGIFQKGEFNIVMAYGPGFITAVIMAMIAFETAGLRFPIKLYAPMFLVSYPITVWLQSRGVSFTALAMPFSLSIALPLFHSAYILGIAKRNTTTRLQKFLSVVIIFNAIHAINFAFFRMDPGAQLWGWLVSFTLCNCLAILLPSISLELAAMTESERLQVLVNRKTDELNKSLRLNDKFVKILIHDISNPLMVMKSYLYLFQESRLDVDMFVNKIQQSQTAMENIILQTKNLHRLKNRSTIPLESVNIEECFKEVAFIFDPLSKQKDVTLNFNNQLPSGTFIIADRTSLTHSVLSNLISNAIKFNPKHSQIDISAFEEDERVIIQVKDEGPGIPSNVIHDVYNNKETLSSIGTEGEKGTGQGLSITKTFIDIYGAQINFITSTDSIGTKVRISLEKTETGKNSEPKAVNSYYVKDQAQQEHFSAL